MTGPQDPAVSGDGRLMASHSDLEQAIETLKMPMEAALAVPT